MFGMTLPRILMIVSMLTVPLLLIPKPLILRAQHQKEQQRLAQSGSSGGFGAGVGAAAAGVAVGGAIACDAEACGDRTDEEEEFKFGEIVIHQVIYTIEYVLGTVSHTASYLRLWALSLAHQQLSLVFFHYTILAALASPFPWNIVGVYLAFAIWFVITVAILCGMDVMECFLHCLRLHWVEFQSKFYYADGTPFKPYCIRTVLAESQG